jgi:rhodanese-related sulfurtransferase
MATLVAIPNLTLIEEDLITTSRNGTLDHPPHTGPALSQAGVQLIDLDEMRSRVKLNTALFVMAMDQRRFDTAHIEGSISFDTLMKELPNLDRDTEVIVYCTDEACAASKVRAAFLVESGFRAVYRFPGGLSTWLEAGLPLARSHQPA